MKLITILGARPQFIKTALFSQQIRLNHDEIIINTGQHYDYNMSKIFFDQLNIPTPNYNLEVGSGSHGTQIGMMISRLEPILLKEKPNGVILYGDTNSTLAGSIISSKLHIPIIHVEAGLRSYNKKMPEEQNRVLTDHLSTLLLCPTANAVENLRKENLENGVFNVGDIMYDNLLYFSKVSNNLYNFEKLNFTLKPFLKSHLLKSNEYYLCTIHRAENTENLDNLIKIFNSFSTLNFPVILPLHPRTKKLLTNNSLSMKNIIVIDPLSYLELIFVLENSLGVITDSGGLQKEAYLLKKICTTLRNETEWIETLRNDWNVLSPINEKNITQYIQRTNIKPYPSENPFGKGDTISNIISLIEKFL